MTGGMPFAHAQLFNGFCLGMLGLTEIECSPSYIGRMKPGTSPSVLRNLHLPAILLNTLMIMLVLTTVPLETVLAGANVLGVLAETVAEPIFLSTVLSLANFEIPSSPGVGCERILSACELFAQAFLHLLPLSGAPYISVLAFISFNAVLYASADVSLAIVSKMFSLVWLTVMSLFPLALLLLRFNRGCLPRGGVRSASLSTIVLALALTPVVFAGNVVIDPLPIFRGVPNRRARNVRRDAEQGRAAARVLGIRPVTRAAPLRLGRGAGAHDGAAQAPAGVHPREDGQDAHLISRVAPRINHLLHMLLYVRENEETACVKIVHFSDADTGIPSELEANAKILDEVFPEIAIDLGRPSSPAARSQIESEGTSADRGPRRVGAAHVVALAHRLQIPPAFVFMSCPGPHFAHPVAEFGTRIISL
ncbi:hypothetical protein B0H17DRAFT_1145369 [Mycena rosella]|uniref:Uncharacterized protein n=1 Tax=Mycena rosella TaxID=1033263 RepID=A0AAD7CR04_MYCRO|nr:hypothetical protein B0H17DRAFT_1145369 [Mycena rosella]